MLLKASPASSSLLTTHGETLVPLFSCGSSPSFSPLKSRLNSLFSNLRLSLSKNGGGFSVSASKGANNRSLTGVIFEPFEEVKKELDLVPTGSQVSLARQKYTNESEAAINEQIK